MVVCDKEKLRPDVRVFIERINKAGNKILIKYLLKKFYYIPKVVSIFRRVVKANKKIYDEKIRDPEFWGSIVSEKELLFLVKHIRNINILKEIKDTKIHPLPENVEIKEDVLDGVPVEWYFPPDHYDGKIIVNIHGGGWTTGSVFEDRRYSTALALDTGIPVVSVDYRLSPEYPFPNGLEDCISVYKQLLSSGYKGKDIVFIGASAGGNLVLAGGLKLMQDGIELPAGIIALSAAIDMTCPDDSVFENMATDPSLGDSGIVMFFPPYIKDNGYDNPLISPQFGDLEGFPPLLLQVSTSEMVHSHSVNFAKKAKAAGVDVTLQEWDDMPHVFQFMGQLDSGLPEVEDALGKLKEFILRVLKLDG
ncbi:MAG: alpha/beta hydrolase [Promethearchaeota archaeon]